MIVKRRKFLIVIAAFCVLGSIFLRASNAANVALPGDLNNDNKVTIADLSILLTNFGKSTTIGDLNNDNKVTIADLSILLTNFGRTSTAPAPPPAPTPTPTPTTTPPPPPPPAPAPAPSPATSPSGEAMPIGDLPGWKQVFLDDFTKDAPTGSWATTNADAVIYTGDHGGKWVTYADGWPSTYTNGTPSYSPSTVISIHNGVMDMHLHDLNGNPQGANSSPYVTGTSNYQLYGRYSVRAKADSNLGNYYAAWLLWPTSDNLYKCAESDFPEGSLDGDVGGFAHYGCGGSQDVIGGGGAKFTAWHTYTQEWSPGNRKYYVDGKMVGQSSNQVWDKPERWQLQTEVNGGSGEDGHVLIDWVAAYSYSP